MLDREREKNYGLTRHDFDEMLREQDHLCAICKRPERALNRSGESRQLSVDHCHETGYVRGLLCHACNIGIGSLGDSPELLCAALKYLQFPAEHLGLAGELVEEGVLS